MPRLALAAAACALIASSSARAQRGGGDWMTSGSDAQRSSWLRGDPKINLESMKKPGFQFLWKLKLKNETRQLNSLTPPALLDFYIGYRGFRSLGFVGGSSDTVTAIDIDIARIEWEKNFSAGSRAPAGSILCPGGMTSAVTRPTSTGYPAANAGRGPGRGAAAKSGVGEPFEGGITLKEKRFSAPPPPPVAASPNRRATPPPNPFGRSVQLVDAVTGDGRFHSMYVSNGEEPKPPVQFLPPGAHAQGLIVFDGNAYVTTVNSCGGVENGVWALDLESQKVTHWKSPGGRIAGTAGAAAGPDGTLYVAAGGELAALEAGTLKLKGSYHAGEEFSSSPVLFEQKGKDLIAIATVDGRIELLGTAALSGQTPLARTPAFSAANFEMGALASWQDASGTRWVLAPAAAPIPGSGVKNGAIVAWKLVDRDGKLSLQPGWISRDLVSPLPPIIVDGVVFALSSGEYRASDANVTAQERAQRSKSAVLYALDGATGKELWNSGSTITSFVHSGGLSGGGTRVYVGAYDGTLYTFGMPMEH